MLVDIDEGPLRSLAVELGGNTVAQVADVVNPSDCEAAVRATIERDHRAGTIGDDETAAYREIIQLADRGAWEEAERRVVDFREDQRPKGWW